MMKNKLLFILLLATSVAHATPPVEEGKTIFTARCAGCHQVNKLVVGPALAGVDQRRSIEWIINFVHSSQTVIRNGDQEAVALFKQFNNIPMPDHKDLSDDNIKNVVAYIHNEAAAAEKKIPAGGKQKQLSPSAIQTVLHSPGWRFTFSSLALLLATVVLFAFKVNQYRRRTAGT